MKSVKLSKVLAIDYRNEMNEIVVSNLRTKHCT